jgi:hypothetical protein
MMAAILLSLAASQFNAANIPPDVATVALESEIGFAPTQFILCARVSGRDASPDVIAALQRTKRTIVPGSECRYRIGSSTASYHIKTKRAAAIVEVEEAKWESPVALTLRVSYHHHGKLGHGRVLGLVYEGQSWKIARTLDEWEN